MAKRMARVGEGSGADPATGPAPTLVPATFEDIVSFITDSKAPEGALPAITKYINAGPDKKTAVLQSIHLNRLAASWRIVIDQNEDPVWQGRLTVLGTLHEMLNKSIKDLT